MEHMLRAKHQKNKPPPALDVFSVKAELWHQYVLDTEQESNQSRTGTGGRR